MVTSSTAPLREVEAELLVVPVLEEETAADLEELDRAVGGILKDARSRGEFRGKRFEQLGAAVQDAGWRARRVLLIGAGRGAPSIRQLRPLRPRASSARALWPS